jgi:hypothetical protein
MTSSYSENLPHHCRIEAYCIALLIHNPDFRAMKSGLFCVKPAAMALARISGGLCIALLAGFPEGMENAIHVSVSMVSTS